MVKQLALGILLLLSSVCAVAINLTATADRTRIGLNESFNLTITQTAGGSETPDIRALEQDFYILGQHQSQRIQMQNGNVQREQQWVIGLQPRRAGTLIIPSFSANGEHTEAIEIEVGSTSGAPSNSSSSNSKETLYGEADVDIIASYVQQQVVLTWRLISKLPIDGVNMSPPDFGDVLAHPMGASEYKRTDSNGQVEHIVEQRYALFPQKSGKLQLPDHYFQVQLLLNRGGFFNDSQTVNIATPALTLEVKPAPNTKSAWLPAKQLQLSDHVSSHRVEVGEPFTRTITINAQGILAEQLPSLQTNARGLKRYAEPVKRQNDHADNDVISQVISSETLIAEQAGHIELPAQTIVWFDTKANEWRETVLAAQTVEVIGTASAQSVPATAAPTAQNTSKDDQTATAETNSENSPATENTSDTASTSPSSTEASHFWQLVALALTCLLLASIGAVVALSVRLRKLATPKPSLSAKPATTKPWQQALKQQDAKALYRELMAEQRQHYDAQRQLVIDQLANHLYNNAAPAWSNWSDVLNSLGTNRKTESAGLTGLYR